MCYIFKIPYLWQNMEIKFGKNDKKFIEGTEDVFNIMQKVLLRDDKIDRDKEHFWILGLNEAGFILYIELIALGSVREVPVEPMNVFRVAIMKNATRLIAVHNHPSGRLTPSNEDRDITDRLIQVGKILNIALVDHLIITPENYLSFRQLQLMTELEKSLKYVPNYQIAKQIRKQEQAIAKQKLAVEKDKTKAAKEAEKRAKTQTTLLAIELINKAVDQETIAKILNITVKQLEKILKVTPI